jgi:hypothetical protein
LNLGYEKRAKKMLAAPWIGEANDDGGALVVIADAAVGNIELTVGNPEIELAFFWRATNQHG